MGGTQGKGGRVRRLATSHHHEPTLVVDGAGIGRAEIVRRILDAADDGQAVVNKGFRPPWYFIANSVLSASGVLPDDRSAAVAPDPGVVPIQISVGGWIDLTGLSPAGRGPRYSTDVLAIQTPGGKMFLHNISQVLVYSQR